MLVKFQGFIKRAALSQKPSATPRVYLDVGTVDAGDFSFSADGIPLSQFEQYQGRVVNFEGKVFGSQFRGDDGKTSQLLRFTQIAITEVAPPSAVPVGNGKPVTS